MKPFRVICINSKGTISRPGIEEGCVYTVVKLGPVLKGELGYVLREVQSVLGAFKASRFIPCSDIDEMELVTAKAECV